MTIYQILNEMNESNSSNYKLEVLKKYSDNELLKRVLKMTYDKVQYTFGVTMKNVRAGSSENTQSLDWALDILENKINTREVTGNAAISTVENILEQLSESDRSVFEKILGRDLKINCGKTQINKVFKDLITKPVYMRCDIYSKKTAKNIKFPALVQLKADGLACFTKINSDTVVCFTRSGEEFILESLQHLASNDALFGVTIQGELLIDNINNRSESNGLINSLIKYKQGNNNTLSSEEANNIESRLIYQIWDYISLEDMKKASNKDQSGTPYIERFEKLKLLIDQ